MSAPARRAPPSSILEEMVKAKPRDEALNQQKTLDEGMAYGRKHFISMLVVLSQGHAPKPTEQKADLLHNQQFIRFVNPNMAIVNVEWPDETDVSAAGRIGPGVFQQEQD